MFKEHLSLDYQLIFSASLCGRKLVENSLWYSTNNKLSILVLH